MENFKKAWTPPFIGDPHGYYIYIWDSNKHTCFNYLGNNEKEYRRIIKLINGEKEKPFSNYGIKGDYILLADENEDMKPLLLVRGWGYLTGMGGLRLLTEEAKVIQENLIEYCAKKLIKKYE